ncbi:MAG: hypothetical protein FWC00_00695 [Firmicutes bacterium]|nr:hypothetical protein [Bacillota bacterium]
MDNIKELLTLAEGRISTQAKLKNIERNFNLFLSNSDFLTKNLWVLNQSNPELGKLMYHLGSFAPQVYAQGLSEAFKRSNKPYDARVVKVVDGDINLQEGYYDEIRGRLKASRENGRAISLSESVYIGKENLIGTIKNGESVFTNSYLDEEELDRAIDNPATLETLDRPIFPFDAQGRACLFAFLNGYDVPTTYKNHICPKVKVPNSRLHKDFINYVTARQVDKNITDLDIDNFDFS